MSWPVPSPSRFPSRPPELLPLRMHRGARWKLANILDEVDQNPESVSVSEENEVELLRSMLVQRPSEILDIYEELFNVFDRALIYKPMYKVTVKNIKTKKEAILLIDAITGKTATGVKQTIAPPKKKSVKKPEKLVTSEENAMVNLFSLASKEE